ISDHRRAHLNVHSPGPELPWSCPPGSSSSHAPHFMHKELIMPSKPRRKERMHAQLRPIRIVPLHRPEAAAAPAAAAAHLTYRHGPLLTAVEVFTTFWGSAWQQAPSNNLFRCSHSTTSHELCEAITDPVPGEGWYDDTNGEIGDICAW